MNKLELEGRWCEYFEELLGNGVILAQNVNNDYQGHAKYLIELEDGRYAVVEWQWGSCCVCDQYEEMDIDVRKAELASCVSYIDTKEALMVYISNIEKTFYDEPPSEYYQSEKPWVLAAKEKLANFKWA